VASAWPRPPWWAAVFALALAARLAYLLLVPEPIRFANQYFYLGGALRIAGDAHPLRLIATSDEWRLWGGRWTIAPLYYIFVGGVFRLFGASVLALQVVQCVLGAMSAVAVGMLGREAAGPRGAWAGAAYAVYWPAVEMAPRVLTENLHVPLLVWGLALLSVAARGRSTGRAAAAGFVLGVSALARSVTSSFLPIAGWIVLGPRGEAKRWKPTVALLGAAAAAILPWSARNVIGTGSLAPIESVWAYNILLDNAFQRLPKYREPFFFQSKKPSEAARIAPRFIAQGVVRNPRAVADKLLTNFGKVIRAEGLHMALDVERPAPAWLLLASVLADDVMLLAAFALLGALAVAGPPSAARRTLVAWTVYYVFMIAVVFHVETRYRSALVPVVLAGAAGGLAVLVSGTAPRARMAVGVLLGALAALANGVVYAPAAIRALRAVTAMEGATDALARGDLATAERRAAEAIARDPGAARPWITWGSALARAGRPAEALEAYGRAALVRPGNPMPDVVRPQLLREAGRPEEAEAAVGKAYDAARVDNWLALEEAWSELPPPRGDALRVGADDFGAVRGFFHARGTFRWTWRRAQLRLMPTVPAPAYQVTLVMGSPEPSPFAAPTVTVRPKGGAEARFTLSRAAAPFTVIARPAPGAPVIVEIESPTWTGLGENAEQGVAVESMTLAPARE